MSRGLGKYLVVAVILVIAAACAKQPPVSPAAVPAPSPTPNPTENWNNYTSPGQYGFSIKYPADFGFSTDYKQVGILGYIPVCDDTMVACVFLNKDNYKGTNLDGAGVSINVLKNLNTEVGCYNFKVPTNEAQFDAGTMVINGITFHHAWGGGGAAGHNDEVDVYRNFRNSVCYEIVLRIASTNIGVYPPGTVQKFNRDEIFQKLVDILDTFNFISNSSASNVGNGKEITLTGTTVCLPHKNVKPGQPQTMECAIGLKDDKSGKFYSLKNSNPPFYDTNVKVEVVGTLVDDSASNYDVVGAIEVTSITKQ